MHYLGLKILLFFAGKNVAEGIVVRPLKNLMGTDAFGDDSRLMVKIKAPEFDETRKQSGDRKKGTGDNFIF